ncbi:hypothetical protein [Ornithobacterium rhinotracheale]
MQNNKSGVAHTPNVQEVASKIAEWVEYVDDSPESVAEDLDAFLNAVIFIYLEGKDNNFCRPQIARGNYLVRELCNYLKPKH